MKKVFLLLVFAVVSSNLSFSQSSCACDSWFGSCHVTCPEGTLARCVEGWHRSCSCECVPYVIPAGGGRRTLEIANKIYLNEVEVLQKIFEDFSSENLSELIKLKNELLAKSNDGVYSTSNENEYFVYFNKLSDFFSSLSDSNKVKFHELINS